jgi:hypothetical protein
LAESLFRTTPLNSAPFEYFLGTFRRIPLHVTRDCQYDLPHLTVCVVNRESLSIIAPLRTSHDIDVVPFVACDLTRIPALDRCDRTSSAVATTPHSPVGLVHRHTTDLLSSD